MKSLAQAVAITALVALGGISSAQADDLSRSVATDSRIKTFVYNENDVYRVVTHYGLQSSIEFGKDEQILTLSIGDQIGWQIIPTTRNIFIKPMESETHTNLSVITNKHTYQFDLISHEPGNKADKELAYLVRFYYPEQDWGEAMSTSVAPPADYSLPAPPPAMPVPPTGAPGMMPPPPPPPATMAPPPMQAYNFNYSLSGDETIAPFKVFDDGQATYFEFPTTAAPSISLVATDGLEQPLAHRLEGSYVVVDMVGSRFSIRSGDLVTCVFNEQWQ